MKHWSMDELLEWLEDAAVSQRVEDAISREHSTTGQTPEYWNDKYEKDDEAYEQVHRLIKIWYKYQLWNLITVTSTIGEQEGVEVKNE